MQFLYQRFRSNIPKSLIKELLIGYVFTGWLAWLENLNTGFEHLISRALYSMPTAYAATGFIFFLYHLLAAFPRDRAAARTLSRPHPPAIVGSGPIVSLIRIQAGEA